jgi:hypothetical protein
MVLFGIGGGGPEAKSIPENVTKSDFEAKLEEAFALYDKGSPEDQANRDQVEVLLKEAGQILARELKANANSVDVGGERIMYIPVKGKESTDEPLDENKHLVDSEYPKFQEFEGAITKVFPEDKRWMVRVTAEAAIEAMQE